MEAALGAGNGETESNCESGAIIEAWLATKLAGDEGSIEEGAGSKPAEGGELAGSKSAVVVLLGDG